MRKDRIIKVLITIAVLGLITVLLVFSFVDVKSCKVPEYTVIYETGAGGRIEGKAEQSVKKGKDAEQITAVANDGYRFLRWEDTSSPDPTRKDCNITQDSKYKAKFVKVSDIKYKILLVYVTEVQATFDDINGNPVVADYKMSEDDLTVCRMTTQLFDICLNELFGGLVAFEIDEYYTTEVMRNENFHYNVFDNYVDTKLFAENVPEVADLLENYGSYITTVPLDIKFSLKNSNSVVGEAMYKTATIKYERNMTRAFRENGTEFEHYLVYDLIENYGDYKWVNLIETYVHELIHTVEQGLSEAWKYPYHNVLSEYSKNSSGRNLETFIIDKLYLLNQAEYDGRTVGIPFYVWTNEVYTLKYLRCDSSMGTILFCGETRGFTYEKLRVPKGYDSGEVTAVPNAGYRFVGWSDGIKTATRVDKNIQSDLEVIAFFEPIEYEINYVATEGGRIEGILSQKVLGTTPFYTVKAVAYEGYRFVCWSDGLIEEQRTDQVTLGNLFVFDENYSRTLYAIFEKINK